MNDLEKQLRDLRLAPPSAELDRRMRNAFAQAAGTVPPVDRKYPWWWLVGLPAAGAAAAILMLSQRPSPPPVEPQRHPIVYHIEPQGLLREMLLTPPARRPSPPDLAVSVRL